MKVVTSYFPSKIVGLAFLGLLVLGLPMTGLSQTPHPCLSNGTSHMSTTLGGVTTFPFYFDKSCPTESNATVWTVKVYNKNNLTNPLPCSFGPVSVPYGPGPYGPVTCNSLQRGSPGWQVRVVIDFERLIGGPMSHTHDFNNP
jgi:hypothetical protein